MTDVVGMRIRMRLDVLDRGPTWLARQLGKHPTTVAGWLAGRHSPSTQQLLRIAQVLETSRAWLLGDGQSKDIAPPKKQAAKTENVA